MLDRPGGQRKRLSKSFPTAAEAVTWRNEALVAVKKGRLHAQSAITVRAAAEQFVDGARTGAIRNRSGDRYKPSAVRGMEEAFRLRIVRDLGPRKLADIQRVDLQRLVSRMQFDGHSPSTIRNTVNAARALYRWAVRDDLVEARPTADLELPAVRGKRDRIATPREADALLAALPEADRPLWTAALLTGMRRGELRALDWSDVDFERGIIHVTRSWDNKAGEITPKSVAGTRDVGIGDELRPVLMKHRLAQGRGGQGLVFGRSAVTPFNASTVQTRADRAWRAAGLERITLHEARHSFASAMIAARTPEKLLQTIMGHGSIVVTYDRYGHLMPGDERDAAANLDAYLSTARTAS